MRVATSWAWLSISSSGVRFRHFYPNDTLDQAQVAQI